MSNIKFIVAHRKDRNNVGDIAAEPLQYFLNKDEYQTIDVAHIDQECYDSKLPMIVGGGGLIGNDFFGDFYKDLIQPADYHQLIRLWNDSWKLSNLEYQDLHNEFQEKYHTLIKETMDKLNKKVGKRFVWGAGHNSNDLLEFEDIKWPKSFANFDLIGIRDYHESSRFKWVPCASCMHDALDKKYEIKNDVIFFEHKKQLIKGTEFGNDSIPRFVNSGNNIDQTIELLGSANIILTNSYHGAYWGTLLGKKVMVIGQWSSKFSFMKHKPTLIPKKEDWRDYVDRVKVYPTSLEECRAATTTHWSRIRDLL